jgi:signal transduction histidine kinase
MMNFSIRLRLIALGTGVAVLGVLIAVVVLELQVLAVQWRTRVSQVDIESFRIADHFRDKLRYCNDKMRHFASTEDAVSWDEFLAASLGLKAWIEQEKSRLTTPHEGQILEQMDSAYATYLQRAKDLHEHTINDKSRIGASVAQFNGFVEQARHFLDLGEALGRAHFESRNDLVAGASRTLTRLRMFVLVLVGLLFVFGGALALRVYQDLIAPLRIRLVETQALAERNEKLASLGLLAAGVAHEIRNPLTAIKTGLFLQQKRFGADSPGRRDGEIIEREISRLERIVTEFLCFARPAQPQPAVVAASQPLKEVQELLSAQLAAADIRLVRVESPPLQVRADPAQLKQVLLNLVQNAADSIGREGTITLRARADRRKLNNGETDVVVLEVTDTGKGITPEVEKRLFDPFFTTKEQGTGLGLSIAARMAEMNGGALQYQTQVNRGSTFGMVLPRVGGDEPQEKIRIPQSESAK